MFPLCVIESIQICPKKIIFKNTSNHRATLLFTQNQSSDLSNFISLLYLFSSHLIYPSMSSNHLKDMECNPINDQDMLMIQLHEGPGHDPQANSTQVSHSLRARFKGEKRSLTSFLGEGFFPCTLIPLPQGIYVHPKDHWKALTFQLLLVKIDLFSIVLSHVIQVYSSYKYIFGNFFVYAHFFVSLNFVFHQGIYIQILFLFTKFLIYLFVKFPATCSFQQKTEYSTLKPSHTQTLTGCTGRGLDLQHPDKRCHILPGAAGCRRGPKFPPEFSCITGSVAEPRGGLSPNGEKKGLDLLKKEQEPMGVIMNNHKQPINETFITIMLLRTLHTMMIEEIFITEKRKGVDNMNVFQGSFSAMRSTQTFSFSVIVRENLKIYQQGPCISQHEGFHVSMMRTCIGCLAIFITTSRMTHFRIDIFFLKKTGLLMIYWNRKPSVTQVVCRRGGPVS
ncbi:hypothetical protein VP01_1110g1 [Puccinia sorghi]|uniref:Uncharacterized protein n=1 Tax=Puccinia sorghi TaxID=27349 RepID=A0A0L6VSM7_9BASI|nr:hypothetical protein VP01_1110g1 [Puccinia sorghi]